LNYVTSSGFLLSISQKLYREYVHDTIRFGGSLELTMTRISPTKGELRYDRVRDWSSLPRLAGQAGV